MRRITVALAAALVAVLALTGAPFAFSQGEDAQPQAQQPAAQDQQEARQARKERRARQARKWTRRGYDGCRTAACASRVKRARIARAGFEGCRTWKCVARVKRKRARRLAASLPYGPCHGGRWAIPCSIVGCESKGSWTAYNPSGARGPYQFLGWNVPWPVRSEADRMAHHRQAKALWRGGAGRSHWTQCL